MSDDVNDNDVNNERPGDDPDRASPAPEPSKPTPPPEPSHDRKGKDRSARLIELAEAEFGDELTDTDRKLFRAVANGEIADFGDPDPEKNDPAKAEHWGPERAIQSDRIRWLCTNPEAKKEVLPHGGVRVISARIDRELRLSRCTLDWHLWLNKCRLMDRLLLDDASVLFLWMEGTRTGPIFAPRSHFNQGLYLEKQFYSTGEVDLRRASIIGDLSCVNGHFENPGGKSLTATGIKVDGGAYLGGGFSAEGDVCLRGATIHGDLVCDNSHLRNPNRTALNVAGIKVGGYIRMCSGFYAEGRVSLLGATVDGSLECDAARLCNANGVALNAGLIRVDGSVYMRGSFEAVGKVNFPGAQVRHWFEWEAAKNPTACALDLRGAHVGTLRDKENSWPKDVHLDGFTYTRIDQASPTDAETRLSWLGLQPKDQYLPQPYNQLAKVLQEMGHEADARKILFEKVNDPARLKMLSWPRRVWHEVLRITIGNGYYPERALKLTLLFMIFGAMVFGLAHWNHGFTATRNTSNPPVAFNALVYSIDAFVPLVDLHQVKYALPIRPEMRFYFWLHIATGWFLTTVLVVGFTGLVRK